MSRMVHFNNLEGIENPQMINAKRLNYMVKNERKESKDTPSTSKEKYRKPKTIFKDHLPEKFKYLGNLSAEKFTRTPTTKDQNIEHCFSLISIF